MKDAFGRSVIRTPDDRFENLEDYPFEPNYIEIDGLRMHYLDEGNKDGKVVLFLHGEPSWSYLYRKMIPIMVKAGYRVIVPDLIGFGKSDKFIKRSDYTFQFHIDFMISFIEKVNINKINLFAQDWGGIIGLRVINRIGDRFAKIAISNTTIPGMFPPKHKNLKFYHKIIPFLNTTFGFGGWYLFSQLVPFFTASSIINKATIGKLSKEVRRAYDAPFPTKEYKAGARIFPALVQSQPKQGKAAWEQIAKWNKPFLTLFSNMDYILGGHAIYFKKIVPGAQGINHKKIQYCGHFCQEDKGEEIAGYLVTFCNTGNIY